MKRIVFTLLSLLASCALLIPGVRAQTANQAPVQVPFSLSAAGQRLPTIVFSGPAATCAIVVYNTGGGFTLVPQVSSDAQNNPTPTWVTATAVGGGSISSASTFVGNIAGTGTTAFGGVLSSLTSGTISGVESCSAAGAGTVAVASIAPVTIASIGPISIANPAPTASPPAGGYVTGAALPTLPQLLCTDNGSTATASAGNVYAVGCGFSTAGATLATALCNGAAFNAAQTCAKLQTPADATTASTSAEVENWNSLRNPGSATWDMQREAPSPAPSGVPAMGYSSSSVLAAPIFCPSMLGGNGTTDALTQIIALSGTTHIYVCSFSISVEGTAAGRFGFVSGTGTNCATPVNNGPSVTFGGVSGASSSLANGTGIGVVFDGGAGNALCIGGTGTSALWTYNITYTQF